MYGRKYRIGFGLIILLSVLSAAFRLLAAEDETSAKKEKHQLHWWESKIPARTNAAEQLAYAHALKEAGHLRHAAKEYRKLVFAWPDAPEAPMAQYNYAQWLTQREKYAKAFDEYQYLIETYAGYIPYDEVLDKQYAMADALATRDRYFLFFKFHTPEEAIPLFETLIQNGPQWSRASELQFRIARIYEKNAQYDLASDAYAVYRQRYPLGPLAEQAGFAQAQCFYKYAYQNPCAVDLRETAVGMLLEFLEQYPHSEMSGMARTYLKDLHTRQAGDLYQQAVEYDRRSRQISDPQQVRALLVGAQICYQRVIDEFPNSPWAETARSRANQVTERLDKQKTP